MWERFFSHTCAPHIMLFVYFVILLFSSTSIEAGILRVPQDHSSIQQALNTAASGDTVLVAPGTYNELLTVPDQSLTLCSDFLYSSDSLDIEQTILDGQWQGTVLTVQSGAGDVFTLQGFTIRRGHGGHNPPSSGAIQLHEFTHAVLTDLIFEENRSEGSGAVMTRSSLDSSAPVLMRNWTIHPYFDQGVSFENGPQIAIQSGSRFCIEGFKVRLSVHAINLLSIQADTVLISDVLVDSVLATFPMLLGGGFRVHAEDYLDVSNFSIRNSLLECGSIVEFECARGSARVSDFQMAHCEIHVQDDTETNALVLRADSLFVDSFRFLENAGQTAYPMCRMIANRFGSLNTLDFSDNVCSPPPFALNSGASPGVLTTRNCSISESQFQRNTTMLSIFEGQDNVRYAVSNGSVLVMDADSSCANMQLSTSCFAENELIDPDDYFDSTTLLQPNEGRVLDVRLCPADTLSIFTMNDCVVEGNLQTNYVPEIENSAGYSGSKIGSSVSLGRDASWGCSVYIRDCLFQANEDGACSIGTVDSLIIRRSFFHDNRRIGLASRAGLTRFDNIVISGTEAESSPGFPESNQAALVFYFRYCRIAESSNCSIYSNRVPTLIRSCSEYLVSNLFSSCLFWDNQFSAFT
jgi:hypothetical protein